MTAATRPRMPADFSDDLDHALYREALHQIPADRRVTCPTHLNWRDRCAHLHEAGS